jgi:hypothetical protein
MSEYTDEEREQAYIILQCCADHYARGRLLFYLAAGTAGDAGDGLEFSERSVWLARFAHSEILGDRDVWGNLGPDRHNGSECYAEASSLIATGWDP